MAQSYYRIDLTAPLFPMLSEQQGRTIIVPQAGEQDSNNKPALAYCHNVMPSEYGLDSVGYLEVIPAAIPAVSNFVDVRIAYGSARSRLYLAWDATGRVYVYLIGAAAWVKLDDTVPSPVTGSFSKEDITIGTVNGVSYIFYSRLGCFRYNESTGVLDPITLTGISIPVTLGVVASSGYLAAYTEEAIAWSSTIDPTDFTPSTVTGAGGGNIAGIGGKIVFILTNSLGLLAYTATNVVAGTYTGNVQFPWKFREVPEAKGGISLDLVAYEANSSDQYVFSKAGLQSVSSNRAKVLLPMLTDFLAGKRFEDFNEVTEEYEITDLTATMQKKLKFIAARYLVISYGVTSFTHAIVLDLALNKLGKLRIPHVDCFEYIDDQTEVAKESLAFVSASGAVQVVDFSVTAASSGVVILGKMRASRTRTLQLLGVDVENVPDTDSFSLRTRLEQDGKNVAPPTVAGSLLQSGLNVASYGFRSTAANHSLMCLGRFNLVSLIIKYKPAGRR